MVYKWFTNVIYIYVNRNDEETLERLCSPTCLCYFVSYVILSHTESYWHFLLRTSRFMGSWPNMTTETLVECWSMRVGSVLQLLKTLSLFKKGCVWKWVLSNLPTLNGECDFIYTWIFSLDLFLGHTSKLYCRWLAHHTISIKWLVLDPHVHHRCTL